MDDALIDTLRASVEANPENLSLKLHFISLLHQNHNYTEALSFATQVLAVYPAQLDALRYAHLCSKALGDGTRAEGYGSLYAALGGSAPETVIPSPRVTLPTQRINADGPVSANTPEPIPVLETEDAPFQPYLEPTTVTLADVAGMEEVKRRLKVAFLEPMRNPELRRLYGRSLRGGLLLYGPPGCGKTFIARAIAGELGAQFLSVGLSDVLDMYIGNSEKNLHNIFETARSQTPCVIFFDEVDALGRKRSQMRGAGANIINQFLAELDGTQRSNEGLFILAATNHVWDVDEALRRPGRLDRTLLVLPPDLAARKSLIGLSLRDRPVERVDLDALAKQTEDFSGADLVHWVESAAELAMEDSILRGVVRPISQGDLMKALQEVKPSTKPWFETAKNHALFSSSGGYAELLDYLKRKRWL